MIETYEVLRAGTGRALRLTAGDALTIVNTHGNQVVDTWAVDLDDPDVYFSVEHTRAQLMRLALRLGDELFSNRRYPMLTLTADTSPGRHDMQMPACDTDRYRVLGVTGYHASCTENFAVALEELGVAPRRAPNPLNLFQNMPWNLDGDFAFAPPTSSPGDSVTLRAESDLIVVLSACPQDLVPVNGADQSPSDVQFLLTKPVQQ